MEVMSHRKFGSTLNPNAPSFVPLAYRAVEDFSDEWWDLIHSSPSFRDYWLQERYQEQILAHATHDDAFFDEPLLPEDDASLFSDFFLAENHDLINETSVDEEGEDFFMKFIATEHKAQGMTELPRYAEKAPKLVKCKVTPSTIQ